MKTLTEAQVLEHLHLKSIEDIYRYIYENFTPENFIGWVFNEVLNGGNVTIFSHKFNDYYLYKVKLYLKIPAPEGEKLYFILEQKDISQIITKHYKINYYGLNHLWHNFYTAKKLNINKPFLSNAEEHARGKLLEFLTSEINKINATGGEVKVTMTQMLQYCYPGAARYGKSPQLKKLLKQWNFKIRNENASAAYIILTLHSLRKFKEGN